MFVSVLAFHRFYNVASTVLSQVSCIDAWNPRAKNQRGGGGGGYIEKSSEPTWRTPPSHRIIKNKVGVGAYLGQHGKNGAVPVYSISLAMH